MSLLIVFLCLCSGYAYGTVSNKSKYIYGYDMTDNKPLRMNRKTTAVEFILWEKGEQGHEDMFWYRMDRSHWIKFKPYESN